MKKYLDMTNEDYRKSEGVANSDLLLIERSASDFIWSKSAPLDNSKTGTFDFGTALHIALLEPEKFNNEVLVYTDTKTRETKAFQSFAEEHQDSGKVILLEAEYNRIRFTADGAMYHPAVKQALTRKADNECSIFVNDKERNIIRKIRPDRDYIQHGLPVLGDVKTTDRINDWRESVRWKNPLFVHDYAHTAAYYMDTASMFYGEEINEYSFILVQKHIEFGRYPVAVINITRSELDVMGAFDRVYANLDKYAECHHSGNWTEIERFSMFHDGFGEVTIEDAE